MESFKQRFEAAAKAAGSRELYAPGPEIVDVPEDVRRKYKSSGAAVFAWGKALLDAAAPKHPAVLLSSIYFGQYGVSGTVAFSALVGYARSLGMLVICDEGIRVTEDNAVFAALAYLTPPTGNDLSETHRIPLEEHGFNADALVVGPESEKKALERLLEAASAAGREVMVPETGSGLKGLVSGGTY